MNRNSRGLVTSPDTESKMTIPLVLLGLALFVVTLGFGMFTPILPQYAVRLGIDATSLGFAYSIYNVALIVCLIPAGVMADRFGRVRTVVVGMVLFSVSSLMLVFVKDLLQFAVARAIEGIGSAVVTPAVFALTADLVPTEKRGSGMGFTSTMETVASLAGPTMGGVIAQTAGFTFPFYAAFVMALVSGALVLPIRDRAATSRTSSSESPLAIFTSLRRNISENKSLLVLCFRGFIVGITQGLFALIFVLYMAFNVGMGPAEVGFSFTIISGSMLAFTFLAGHLSDRFGRKPFVILGGIIIASMVIAFSFAQSASEVYLVSIALGLGVALNNAPINALLADCVIPEIRAKVMGGYEVVLGLGRTLGVLLLGGLYAMSVLAPFYLLGALMFATVGLVALFVTEPQRASLPPQ
ncbi:MFS transporter [Candidatus Bathyarchaeota archaeon]|jgi:MFS family permease|nr:MFS transporter [Candidatus Bathyarchaeota archaeon]